MQREESLPAMGLTGPPGLLVEVDEPEVRHRLDRVPQLGGVDPRERGGAGKDLLVEDETVRDGRGRQGREQPQQVTGSAGPAVVEKTQRELPRMAHEEVGVVALLGRRPRRQHTVDQPLVEGLAVRIERVAGQGPR
ncbi:hypothetical protein [Nucisporomicrobium flavum]|uniref:hypothetical protein n=1 Tax=Nucisporomicrobium flavum TaxID=2785915 RepID=UPI0018F2ED5C|nr:hypothetical protein [Nucisporomicrobium flavum]